MRWWSPGWTNRPAEFTPAQTVETLAQRKGEAVLALRPEMPIIAADSVVSIDGLILGKPADDQAAKGHLAAIVRPHPPAHHRGVPAGRGEAGGVPHEHPSHLSLPPSPEAEIDEYVAMGEFPGPRRRLRHRGHRRCAGPVHPGGLSQHCGPARGGDAPPPGANCWKRNWHPNRPARVGYGWGWFHGQRASQVPVHQKKREGQGAPPVGRRPCSPGGTALSEWGLGSISEELTQEAARAYVLAQVNQAVRRPWPSPGPL